MSALLQCKALSKSFGSVIVADAIDLSVAEGKAVGVIGPNGAGKTSLFNLITGTLSPSSGRIVFADRDITSQNSAARCRLGNARSFQIPQPFSAMSVFENALVAATHNASGVTIAWIEHIVHALLEVAERLIVLDFGKVIADGEPAIVMASHEVQENHMGMAADA